MSDQREESMKHLRQLNEMLKSEAWQLLEKHWELQENHNRNAALDEKLPPDSRAVALGAFRAISAMRTFAKVNLPNSLKSYLQDD